MNLSDYNIICVPFSWWSSLEKTNWLHHISLLLKATNIVVNAIHKEQRPVVVHCSDGWDRTTQIVALAELMLDPYYRTIEVHVHKRIASAIFYVFSCKLQL